MEKKDRFKNEDVSTQAPTQSSKSFFYSNRMVDFVGVGFIITSLLQLRLLLDFKWYCYLFQDYPGGFIQIRHLISCSSRWVGIALGVGLLFRKEFFRKSLIVLAMGTMVIVYWKHPYSSVMRQMQYSSELMPSNGLPFSPVSVIQYLQAWNVSWAPVSLVAHLLRGFFIASDICFALTVIFLLTRPSVKSLFK